MNRPKLNQVRKRYICECRLSRLEKLYYIAVKLPRHISPVFDVLKIELTNLMATVLGVNINQSANFYLY